MRIPRTVKVDDRLTVKKAPVTLAFCALLITGCASASPDTSEVPRQETTQTQTDLPDPNHASCKTLVGSDGGLVSETAQFLTDVDGLSDSNASKAGSLAAELHTVAGTSDDHLRKLLVVMQEPLRELVTAHKTKKSFRLDPARFKAAANEVISICESESASGAAKDIPRQ